MARLALAVVSLLALSTSCSPTATGIECTKRDDCAPSQECFTGTKVPGGFCSRGCTQAGQQTECGAGTVCIRFFDTTQICSPRCTSDAECRVNYACSDAGGGSKACRPNI